MFFDIDNSENNRQIVVAQIAISNNCSSLMDNALRFQKDYKKDDSSQLKTDKAFSNMIKSFEKLREERFVAPG